MTEMYMGFKNFSWPRLPDVLKVENGVNTSVLSVPENGELVQELGRKVRRVTGSGSFLGCSAAEQWTALCKCFDRKGAGTLFLPGTKPFEAEFCELKLLSGNDEKKIEYSFVFCEMTQKKHENGIYITKEGESLWSAAAACGTEPEKLREANVQRIRWANGLEAGIELTVP